MCEYRRFALCSPVSLWPRVGGAGFRGGLQSRVAQNFGGQSHWNYTRQFARSTQKVAGPKNRINRLPVGAVAVCGPAGEKRLKFRQMR